MTVKELVSKLEKIIERDPEAAENDVLITTEDRSIGARASVGVLSVMTGFDWEAGQVRIQPEGPVVKKKNEKENAKKKYLFRERISDKKFLVCSVCELKVSKNDQYCKHCGQKLSGEVEETSFLI